MYAVLCKALKRLIVSGFGGCINSYIIIFKNQLCVTLVSLEVWEHKSTEKVKICSLGSLC